MLFGYPVEEKKLLTDVKTKAFNVLFALVSIKKVSNERVTSIINTKNKRTI